MVFEKTRAKYLFFNTSSEYTNGTGKTQLTDLSQTPIQPISFDDDRSDAPSFDVANDGTVQNADAQTPALSDHTRNDTAERAHPTIDAGSSSEVNTDTAGSDSHLRAFTLYWISIDNDGTILRHAKTHLIPQSDSPLTDALTVLLQHPTRESEKNDLLSLIPSGTQLRSVRVQDGIAFIDFSDEFQFNQYGIEGYLAQLAQVVFTATEFPTVNAVQFLIEGQKKEYLGSEGVWIGTPLTRNLF